MKPNATQQAEGTEANAAAPAKLIAPRKNHRRHRYQKVYDGRKQPIRGLWIRNGRFIARIKAENTSGKKELHWRVLGSDENPVTTVAQAKEAYRKLLTQRDDGKLPILKRTPKFADYAQEYLKLIENKKRPATVSKERSTLNHWIEHIGALRIDQIRKRHVTAVIEKRLEDGIAGRTVNLDVIALRNVIKRAIDDEYLTDSPLKNLRPVETETKSRDLVNAEQIDRLCNAAFECRYFRKRLAKPGEPGKPLKNAQQFADYIRLMAACGSRRDETLRLRWSGVNWDLKQLTIGADGLSKNRKSRVVDFNANLEALLKAMFDRRVPDSQWLFPSPQRGERDASARTFKESLNLARDVAGMKHFGFHDCRHHFISYAVMSGIDFMTIAEWVGHQDGGILIGKVYGHLAQEHRQKMAEKLNFGPIVLPSPAGSKTAAGSP